MFLMVFIEVSSGRTSEVINRPSPANVLITDVFTGLRSPDTCPKQSHSLPHLAIPHCEGHPHPLMSPSPHKCQPTAIISPDQQQSSEGEGNKSLPRSLHRHPLRSFSVPSPPPHGSKPLSGVHHTPKHQIGMYWGHVPCLKPMSGHEPTHIQLQWNRNAN